MRLWRYLLKVRWPKYEWRNLPREKAEVLAMPDMGWKQRPVGSYPCRWARILVVALAT
jgi:hypothetical protein